MVDPMTSLHLDDIRALGKNGRCAANAFRTRRRVHDLAGSQPGNPNLARCLSYNSKRRGQSDGEGIRKDHESICFDNHQRSPDPPAHQGLPRTVPPTADQR
jgi:hypothetical protein